MPDDPIVAQMPGEPPERFEQLVATEEPAYTGCRSSGMSSTP